MSTLSTIFAYANCLTASEPSPDLKSIFFTRLTRYYNLKDAKFPDDFQIEQYALEDLQRLTAKEALNTVLEIQAVEQGSSSKTGHALGARDLAQLRTLVSIVFRWGTEPLLTSCLLVWPPAAAAGQKIIDYESISGQYKSLVGFAVNLMSIILPNGPGGSLANTHVAAVLINRYLVDLLKICLASGWLPKSLAIGSIVAHDPLRPVTLRLVSILQPAQAIASLGGVLSSKPEPSPHMRRISTMLLGKQIIRPDGVDGLYAAVFGEEDMTGDEAPLEKLEHISRVLTTVPPGTQPQAFYQPIVYQISSSLSKDVPSAHKRAAAFAVSRMLAIDSSQPHLDICARYLLSCLHDGFLHIRDSESESPQLFNVTPSTAISALGTLVANMDPHPASISRLLSPIVSQLYSLLHHLDKIKTSDPGLRESLNGLLITWGKIVESSEGLDCLWSIYQAEEIHWKVDIAGDIHRVHRPPEASSLSLFTPESLEKAEKAGSLDEDANIMDLYPDPSHYVRFLKAVDRPDITSNLFIKFLETYRDQRLAVDANPVRTLLTLQIVVQMQKQLSTGPSSSNLLCKPGHMLQFIKHVLESSSEPRSHPIGPKVRRQRDIRFTGQPTELDADVTGYESEDSDDDVSDSETVTPNDEMVETVINLLLSILEENDELSARTVPILNDIYSLLEPMSRDSPSGIRSIAREARMVMTAHLASTSVPKKSRSKDEESSQEIYQKALKLLQDPILPVRAHGLLLLRQLVTRSKNEVEHALIPAILSIFLQSIQDDESYLFLQSVQGLAAMVDSYGQDVLKALVREYTDGLVTAGPGSMSRHDLDIRTRIGEALGIVVRRCGSTLGLYSNLLIPPLFAVVRSQSAPTAIRTSALSLLADCVKTYIPAVLSYVVDLIDAVIDLLQVESVPAREISSQPEESEADAKPDETLPTMDSQPLSTDSKFPPLRRAALHFLSLLIRSLTEQAYEKSFDVHVYMAVLRRAKTTLAYVASTDADSVVRVMAREAGEGLEQLQQALLGF